LSRVRLGQLAALAEIDASTLSRMEGTGLKPGMVDAVRRALKVKGVEITWGEAGVPLRQGERTP
jgi:hypothetical protein